MDRATSSKLAGGSGVSARSHEFGRELRRLRLAAGLTLTGLAGKVYYSKGQLSKVERGLKPATRELAQLCDAALGGDGALVSLIGHRSVDTDFAYEEKLESREEVWVMQLSPDGSSSFRPMDRRDLMASGAVSVIAIGLGAVGTQPGIGERSSVEAMRLLFDQYRVIGQSVSPGVILPALIAQTHTMRELAIHADPKTRLELLHLGSRYAEYVGWLVQETGDDEGALWWTQRAVELAAAGGDQDLAAYAMVRRALVTLYRDDGEQTVALAQRAQDSALPARIRGLAAQREAQGHAINGDLRSCMSPLDRARDLLAAAAADAGEAPVIGTTNLTDPVGMITGWCLHDLGRPKPAAEIMDRELKLVPARALRTHVRYGTRRARAHAAAGDIEHACELTRGLLTSAVAVDSATIAADLRRLAHTLRRHHRNPSVQALAPDLSESLSLICPEES